MNHTEKDIELIEKYFEDDLSEFDTESFKRRVQTDEEFRALLEQEKYIVGAIRIQGLKDELDTLKRMEAALKDPEIKIHQPIDRRWYILAAAVIALLIVSRFALTPTITTESLYEDNYRPYPNVFEPTVRSQTRADERTEAFLEYEKGNYAGAAKRFRELLGKENNDGMLLLLGNCNLMLGNTGEAITNFTQLGAQSPELSIQANWFLSMAYLKNDDKVHALPLLKELSATDGSYAEKARAMIKELTP
jgi:tetratricopeptide (TPR) repeat protein